MEPIIENVTRILPFNLIEFHLSTIPDTVITMNVCIKTDNENVYNGKLDVSTNILWLKRGTTQ